MYYPENSPDGQKLNVEEKKARMRNENTNNIDRNDRDRNDRLPRTISGSQRNSGDRDCSRGIGLNRTSNSSGMLRSGPPGGNTQRSNAPGGRPFNRNDRQQGGTRGGNTNTSNTTATTGNGSGGGYRR